MLLKNTSIETKVLRNAGVEVFIAPGEIIDIAGSFGVISTEEKAIADRLCGKLKFLEVVPDSERPKDFKPATPAAPRTTAPKDTTNYDMVNTGIIPVTLRWGGKEVVVAPQASVNIGNVFGRDPMLVARFGSKFPALQIQAAKPVPAPAAEENSGIDEGADQEGTESGKTGPKRKGRK